MEVKIILNNEYEKELLITAPWKMIKDDYESLLKLYAKFPVKGFRAGKSPIGYIETNFAQQIKKDLITAVSTRLCRRAMIENDMEAGTPIEITDGLLQKNEYLQFKANFIEMPEFELPDYAALNLQSENKNEKLDEISQKLLDSTDISLHPVYIENELKYSGNNDYSENERCNAEARVKLMLILKKIARQEQIEPDEKDIEERIKVVAADNDVTPEVLKKFLIENRGLPRFTDSLLAEKVLEYIIEIQIN